MSTGLGQRIEFISNIDFKEIINNKLGSGKIKYGTLEVLFVHLLLLIYAERWAFVRSIEMNENLYVYSYFVLGIQDWLKNGLKKYNLEEKNQSTKFIFLSLFSFFIILSCSRPPSLLPCLLLVSIIGGACWVVSSSSMRILQPPRHCTKPETKQWTKSRLSRGFRFHSSRLPRYTLFRL